jgi:hypothetical protein
VIGAAGAFSGTYLYQLDLKEVPLVEQAMHFAVSPVPEWVKPTSNRKVARLTEVFLYSLLLCFLLWLRYAPLNESGATQPPAKKLQNTIQ